MATPESGPPATTYICVLGNHDATDPANHQTRRRVEVALDYLAPGRKLAFVGGGRPGMSQPTEADTMRELALRLGHPARKSLASACVIGDGLLTTSQKTRAIAQLYLWRGSNHIYLVTNWIYMPRTWFLLRHWTKESGMDWSVTRKRIHLVWCGGVFGEYLYHDGPRALLWRLLTVPLNEARKWLSLLLPWTWHTGR